MVGAPLPFLPSLGLCWGLLQRVGDALGTHDRVDPEGCVGTTQPYCGAASHPRTQEEELRPGGLTPLVSFSPYGESS